MRARLAAFLTIVMVVLACSSGHVTAQSDDLGGASYVTPFPENDTYRMLVVGDSLAEGMLYGLTEAFSGGDNVQLQRKRRPLNSLARNEFSEELKALEDPNWREPLHIAIVMVGMWDRVSLRNDAGRRFAVGSPEWRDLYGQRVDQLMKLLKRKKAAVYWVGLPVVRRGDWNKDIETINEIARERAFLNGLKFVDVTASFADEEGAYAAYGPDITGKIRLLREGDGVHFTEAGYRKLAFFVERIIRRDLTQAKAERTIPLLGSEAEQRRISPNKPEADGAAKAAAAKAKAPQRSATAGANPVAANRDGEQKADSSRIQLRIVGSQNRDETVTIELPRPAIPATVMALLTRRESAERPSQLGDTLTDEIAGGLLVMTSVAPSADSGARRRLAPTQAPFFRVLVKGERVQPKPGRVDDFTWPKPEASADAGPSLPAPTATRGAEAAPRTGVRGGG